MISQKQIKLMWVLSRQLDLDNDDLHKVVFGITGKKSIKTLSVMEGKEVIDALIQAGAKVKKKRRPRRDLPPNVIEMATRKQRRLIKYLEKSLGWDDNPERLNGFVRRTIKKKVISTKLDAMKIIEGLKGMAEREERKEVAGNGGVPV